MDGGASSSPTPPPPAGSGDRRPLQQQQQQQQQGGDDSYCWTEEKLLRASYKDLGSPGEVQQRYYDHLMYNDQSAKCLDSLWQLLRQTSTTTRDYSITIDAFDLLQSDPVLGHLTLRYPATLLPLLESAVVQAQQTLLQQHQAKLDSNEDDDDEEMAAMRSQVLFVKGGGGGGGGGSARAPGAAAGDGSDTSTSATAAVVATTRVHARLVHLPPSCCKTTLACMRAQDVGKILQVSGTVVRTSSVQMYESTRTYQCCTTTSSTSNNSTKNNDKRGGNKSGGGCGRTFCVYADLEQRHNALSVPDSCPLMDPASGMRCRGTCLKLVESGSVHTDYQEIKIQEGASSLRVGHIPRSLLIKLQHDLVDQCQPGDEVVVVGSLLAQWEQQPGSMGGGGGGSAGKTTHHGGSSKQAAAIIASGGVDCQVGLAMSAHSVRVIAEIGSSAWKAANSSSGSSGRNNHSGGTTSELDKYRKEFDEYWLQNVHHQEYPIQARDYICKAICPRLYGLQIIKLALLITLIGGVSSSDIAQQQQNYGDRIDNASRKRSLQETMGDVGETRNLSVREGGDNDEQQQQQQPDQFCIASTNDDDDRPSANSAYYGDNSSVNNNCNIGNSTIAAVSNKINKHPRHKQKQRQDQQVKTRRRDQSHILLVGDPGTGKSQFLRFAAALCPRAVLTTGVGTTSAGLTCAAVREGNGKEFALEAGALVLADKGVCCIDEFGCIQEKDRTTIHEAMEQQTLSVAKAGIVCKLNCRATIIAVMNPRDCLYDNNASLSVNTGLGTPLLSRFDIIFKLVDSSDIEREHNVTTYLLNRAIHGAGLDVVSNNEEDGDGDDQQEKEPWSMEKLRAYISVVKEIFQPVMSDGAAMLLERHYEKCRSAQSNTIPITVRFLESLIRLSQAHARLMYHNTVTLQDAVAVIRIMECTAYTYGGYEGHVKDNENIMYCDPISIDFSPEADLDFVCFEYQILKRYGMLHLMPDNDRKKALVELNIDDGPSNATSANSSWQLLENPRDIGQNAGHFGWVPEPGGPAMGSPVFTQQDHYGRVHVSRTDPKNVRGGG